MTSTPSLITVPTLTNDGQGASYFSAREIELNGDITRQLSDQIGAVNFRLRRSIGYSADYHVAGDPTLLIVLSGTMRIELPSGEYRDFSVGEMYIAEDYLTPNTEFKSGRHGHRAQTIGSAPYNALHLKLARRETG